MQILPSRVVRLHAGTGSDVLAVGLPSAQAVRTPQTKGGATVSDLFLETSAKISECGTYRYSLSRVWEPELPDVIWIMLNPSTADADKDDPTIRRCCAFAKEWLKGGIEVLNLFAARATDPKHLQHFTDPIGPENDNEIRVVAASKRLIVAGWGSHLMPRCANDRWVRVMRLLAGRKVFCLGTTKNGRPKHPLYVLSGTKLVPFQVELPCQP